MFPRNATVCIGLLCLLGVTVIAQCTPEYGLGEVHSQADADTFNICDTFNSTLIVDMYNLSDLLSMDNIKHITGNLYVEYRTNLPGVAGMATFSMKSLQSISGDMTFDYVTPLQHVNLPVLTSMVHRVRFDNLDNLSTVNLSSLTSVGALTLSNLPAIQSISFESGLTQFSGYGDTLYERVTNIEASAGVVTILNTSLSHIDGLAPRDLGGLVITANQQFSHLTLPLESINCIYSHDVEFSMNERLNLSLPALKTVNCSNFQLSEIAALSIPVLTTINGSLTVTSGKLTTFDAPSLVSVTQKVLFLQGNFSSINLPALQSVGGEFYCSENPAIYVENGINLPNITAIQGMHIFGDNTPYCRVLDNQRCRGLIQDYYSCGLEWVAITADPGSCDDTYPIHGLTKVTKLHIGLGVSLGVLTAVGLSSFCYYLGKKVGREQAANVAAALELELAEDLPKYELTDGATSPAYEVDIPVADDVHHVAGRLD